MARGTGLLHSPKGSTLVSSCPGTQGPPGSSTFLHSKKTEKLRHEGLSIPEASSVLPLRQTRSTLTSGVGTQALGWRPLARSVLPTLH